MQVGTSLSERSLDLLLERPNLEESRERLGEASLPERQMDAAEILTLADLRHRWPRDGSAPRLAVLGDPVAHSLSPGMHDAALAACGIPARYGRLHVRPEELAETLALLPARGFLGVNLTIPHKTAAVGLMSALDESARRLGAVNTVRVEAGGTLRGFNTDGPGFVRAVRESFDGAEVADLRVLLLGAGGGAGRALAIQCALEGCAALTLVNRTPERAARLAGELSQKFHGRPAVAAVPWQREALALALQTTDLLVNASAVGLAADDPPAVSGALLDPRLRVFDTVYRRQGEPTGLVRAARAAGAQAVDGLPLLLHQGALAFEIWFDRPAPLETMRAALRQAAEPTGAGTR